MSFFSKEQFLDSMTGLDEMRMKENAPSLYQRSESSDREKRRVIRLEDIPEATPGPNAFAQQAVRVDRYRQDGNAFYQQEVQNRQAAALASVHPALRMRSLSDPPTPPRDSTCTTMSPFINAGTFQPGSPPLRLTPSNTSIAEPTRRGRIEEHREKTLHLRSGSKEERTPVFIPTPKIQSVGFDIPAPASGKKPEKEVWATQSLKTPKKGLFGRLKLKTNFHGYTSPSTTTLSSVADTTVDENTPAKAKAILGTSPTKSRASLGSASSRSNLPRSPSKRKGLFSRKSSNLADFGESPVFAAQTSAQSEHPPPTTSTAIKTPQTAFSDPTHYSYQSIRIASQAHSDKGPTKEADAKKCAIARSQSLKYFDHAVPPTPPAKNTPPDEKARREALLATKSSRLPFHGDQTTPTKEAEGIVSISGSISPTKFGSYGHRETPTLITRPSVYSLHASVVPNMTEASRFEEMKARIDGLSLEGFNIPPENVRSPVIEKVYSPSMYSTEWDARPTSVVVSPALRQVAHISNSPSTHTKQSSSSGVTIPICYPELANDPSVSNMTTLLQPSSRKGIQQGTSSERLEVKIPWHGLTHSRDHSTSPRHSLESAIFAQHFDDDLNEPYYESPTSFSHASATPSPLQCLPATVYMPSKISKLQLQAARTYPSHQQVDATPCMQLSSGLGIHRVQGSMSGSPLRHNEVFENVPSLPALKDREKSRSPSPLRRFDASQNDLKVDVDPKKTSPSKSPASDKLNRMIDMLHSITSRNHEISSMRDEMRATNSRLNDRLAAVETSQRASSPQPSMISESSSSFEKMNLRASQNRVGTSFAHDFYRTDSEEPLGTSAHVSNEDSDHADIQTIAELKDTNRRLLEMVGGFAEKIRALESKVKQ